MRVNWHLSALVSVSVLLISCSTTTQKSPTQLASQFIQRESVTTITHQTYTAKNPAAVALYTSKSAPPAAYRIIGFTSVSKRNIFGMPRQNETVDMRMKKLAASIGGDGIIDVHSSENEVQAKVIAYQKIIF